MFVQNGARSMPTGMPLSCWNTGLKTTKKHLDIKKETTSLRKEPFASHLPMSSKSTTISFKTFLEDYVVKIYEVYLHGWI